MQGAEQRIAPNEKAALGAGAGLHSTVTAFN
jgi:hypothetical protein